MRTAAEAPKTEDIPPLRHYLPLMVGMVLFVELNAMVLQMTVPALSDMARTFDASALPSGTHPHQPGRCDGAANRRQACRSLRFAIRHPRGRGAVPGGQPLLRTDHQHHVLLLGRVLEASVTGAGTRRLPRIPEALPARYLPMALSTLGTGLHASRALS